MSYRVGQTVLYNANAAQESFTDKVPMFSGLGWYAQYVLADAKGANPTFEDTDVTVGTDTITSVAHGLQQGTLVTLTSTGTLPAGLALATNYYVIYVDADNFKLAADLADAAAGTAVDITAAAGGGTHTVVITAALDVTITAQATAKDDPQVDADWIDLASPAPVNPTDTTPAAIFTTNYAWYRHLRFKMETVSGIPNVRIDICTKG